ncbi:hypothetical protein Ahy_A01g003640 isoform B [Arachis hypogaea]|uniref:Uncharacterized protein n=1 Tax=Arachis hypogaea TaxID=3818 RepID=A0A445ETP7_ARAHY|nr:hypothetical protein Ahy_A01g003640 isoform B [Arachis hypogaea]
MALSLLYGSLSQKTQNWKSKNRHHQRGSSTSQRRRYCSSN